MIVRDSGGSLEVKYWIRNRSGKIVVEEGEASSSQGGSEDTSITQQELDGAPKPVQELIQELQRIGGLSILPPKSLFEGFVTTHNSSTPPEWKSFCDAQKEGMRQHAAIAATGDFLSLLLGGGSRGPKNGAPAKNGSLRPSVHVISLDGGSDDRSVIAELVLEMTGPRL